MYLLFGGESYYASGGANDFISGHVEFMDAVNAAEEALGKEAVTHIPEEKDIEWDELASHTIEWVHIFKCDTKEIVFRFGEPYGGKQILTVT